MNEAVRKATIVSAGMWRFRYLGLAVAWGVGALALVVLLAIPSRYEASARIFVNTDSILKPLMTGLTVQPNEDQRIQMLSHVVISRPNVERLVAQVGLDASAKDHDERERVIDSVTKSLEFKGGGRDSIYTLSFRDVDAARAKQVIALLAQLFIDSSRGGKSEDTETAKRFIDEQVANYDHKLQEAENRLKEFRLRYLGVSPGDGHDYFQRMSEASRQLEQARLELREAERSRDAYRRQLAADESVPTLPGGQQANTMLADIDARLDAMRRNLDTLLQKDTENHPDVVGAKMVIRDLEEQRRKVVASLPKRAPGPDPAATSSTGLRASEQLKVSLAQTEASVAALSMRVAEYNERYEKLKASAALVPQLEAEYAQLNRDYDVNKKNYESLVTRRESASMSGEMQTVAGVNDFRMVDPPRVTPLPVSPKRHVLLPLALIFALACGFGAMYLAQEWRPAFHDAHGLREATGLPVVGTVTALESEGTRREFRHSVYRAGAAMSALVVVYAVALVAVQLVTAQHV
ncbi:MAG TPA: XrtA system polysaccharide chain length determinant [Usitatibacter sp.]|jgi:polysaccharide chain length determinant protein (PEP-CTERM system associated)|nr:XrtA system polysaccharide chain length determinant [Usitatibacter sp.]